MAKNSSDSSTWTKTADFDDKDGSLTVFTNNDRFAETTDVYQKDTENGGREHLSYTVDEAKGGGREYYGGSQSSERSANK
jgi:hypothetical protein